MFDDNTSLTSSFDSTLNDAIGSPTVYIEQTTDFTCAVVSQEMILHDFGINLNEQQLGLEAMQHGWLLEDGTPFADIGKLLDLHGVPNHINENGNLMHLSTNSLTDTKSSLALIPVSCGADHPFGSNSRALTTTLPTTFSLFRDSTFPTRSIRRFF